MVAFLAAVYPKGRWIWFLLGIGTGLARVRLRHHYPEDVLCGGALGWIVAQWVFTWRWPLALGDWVVGMISRVRRREPGSVFSEASVSLAKD
jgi:membrane-associated phospholipid phosphatase